MATFYVDDAAGNDGNVGNSGSPWKTLGKAKTAAAAGDTVRVRAGTYREQLDITKANMTWMADNPAAKPVVDGGYHIGLMSGGNTITKNSTMPAIHGIIIVTSIRPKSQVRPGKRYIANA